MAAETKKVSELNRSDMGRKVRYEPDEDTRETGVLTYVAHFVTSSTLNFETSQHTVTDADATVTLLD
ncbi:hypothetical protein [Arthrobacter sp. Z1-15]